MTNLLEVKLTSMFSGGSNGTNGSCWIKSGGLAEVLMVAGESKSWLVLFSFHCHRWLTVTPLDCYLTRMWTFQPPLRIHGTVGQYILLYSVPICFWIMSNEVLAGTDFTHLYYNNQLKTSFFDALWSPRKWHSHESRFGDPTLTNEQKVLGHLKSVYQIAGSISSRF